ncbi:MAG: Uroporphyrinogen deCOase protein, partial [Candidatus Poribacteria bacterium]|nr:Uroporphyrinogen deCOase protein [Candidatus Poribacteria bacterium]
MSWRDDILAVMSHKEVRPVPFTLGIDGGIAQKMDEYYGTADWRNKLVPYIVGVGGAPYIPFIETMENGLLRDAYGGIWRNDMNIPHHVQVGLPEPTLKGFEMPDPNRLLPPESINNIKEACKHHTNSFTIMGL